MGEYKDTRIASLREEHRQINKFFVENLCEKCGEAYLKFLREKSGGAGLGKCR